MDEDLKEALKLIFYLGKECMLHELKPGRTTNPKTRERIFKIITKHNLNSTETMAAFMDDEPEFYDEEN